MTLPLYDLNRPQGAQAFRSRVERLRLASSTGSEVAQKAVDIIEQVRCDGDAAIVRQMRQWADADYAADQIRVTADELVTAERSLNPELKQTIIKAIDHVRAYQQHIMPQAPQPIELDGAELGLRFVPVDSAGLTVPGGSAVLFSTLIMLTVPAEVAGVKLDQISIVNPPPYRKTGEPACDISPIVLATCRLLGLGTVYRIGGPAAVAALTYGTETVRPVDLIVGPGHPIVAAAQARVRGVTGTGDSYGASEIVIVADDLAHLDYVAADLIAQAEHNQGKCFLVAWSSNVIDQVLVAIKSQLPNQVRCKAIAAALDHESAAILVANPSQAVEVVNTLAPEHLTLAVQDPDELLLQIRHAGAIFLGDQSPVAAGDYWAGPSHTLPTDTTARFASGVSVYTFLKRTSTICYRQGMDAVTIDAIARLADAESLDGHAASVRMRGE